MASLAPVFHERGKYNGLMVNDIPCEWIIPTNAVGNKVLLYFHGGGYATGSIYTHKPLLMQICKHAAVRGFIFEYKLSPEHKYPAALNDSIAVYDYLLEQGYAPNQIAFAGDSAGGGLAMATILRLRDEGRALPCCYTGLSPWFDLTSSGESHYANKASDAMLHPEGLKHYAANYAGDTDLSHPYVSPLFAELHDLPPICIHVCESEILLDDSVRFVEKARLAQVNATLDIYGDLLHVWHAFWPIIPEARMANRALGSFIAEHLRQGHRPA